MSGHVDAPYGRALARLMRIAGFCGLGTGLRETCGRITAERAWRVYVRRKLPIGVLPERQRIPSSLIGLPTDVIEWRGAQRAAATADAGAAAGGALEGAGIVNDRGVPGTLGCIAQLRRTGEPVLLSSYHVLFGRRSGRGDPIWTIELEPRLIGRVLSGKAGVVVGVEPPTFVDAAAGRLLDGAEPCAPHPIAAAAAAAGEMVSKSGAATGMTHGIVVDIAYPDSWYWEYRSEMASRQLLIRSTSPIGRPFSRTGDSGAVVRNESGDAVGLLWGTTARGDGVASPMHAAALALGIQLAARTAPFP